MSFEGQWIGRSNGDPTGWVILDMESDGETVFGIASLTSNIDQIPSSLIRLRVSKSERSFSINCPISHFDGRTGKWLDLDTAKRLFPDVGLPLLVNVEGTLKSDSDLEVNWKTPLGTHGTVQLKKSILPKKSRINANEDVKNWADFKSHISSQKFGDYIFRGQSYPHPLCTSFHRTRRKDLLNYLEQDVPRLHRSLTGRTRHVFNPDIPNEMGAFLNLAQHHGYPTPLLDWSYSPYVAAWFAYREASVKNDSPTIRVFSLNKVKFQKLRHFQSLTLSPPHFSILEALAIENERAVPQQGLLTLTNLHDIELHLLGIEARDGEKLITAFDLPIDESAVALNELAMMGITRSTMYPSIESICLDLKERAF